MCIQRLIYWPLGLRWWFLLLSSVLPFLLWTGETVEAAAFDSSLPSLLFPRQQQQEPKRLVLLQKPTTKSRRHCRTLETAKTTHIHQSLSFLAGSSTCLNFAAASANNNNDDTKIDTILDIGAATIAGADPNRPQKVNQDAYFISPNILGSDDNHKSSNNIIAAVGVMDGHGKQAQILTQYLAKRLPECIQEQLLLQQTSSSRMTTELEEQIQLLANYYQEEPLLSPYHEVLRNAFHQSHWDAMQNPNVPAGRCGTTCIVCLVEHDASNHGNNSHDKIHVAHVGDSRVYRFIMNVNKKNNLDKYGINQQTADVDVVAEPLSTPTTVQDMPTERERIEFCIQQQQQQQQQGARIDFQGNVWYGPIGIAMTRALGDAFLLRAGVVPTPLVETFFCSKNTNAAAEEEWIVLATDGVWDALTISEISNILWNPNQNNPKKNKKNGIGTAKEVAQAIVQAAKQAWMQRKNGPVIAAEEEIDPDQCSWDDITCVVLRRLDDSNSNVGTKD